MRIAEMAESLELNHVTMAWLILRDALLIAREFFQEVGSVLEEPQLQLPNVSFAEMAKEKLMKLAMTDRMILRVVS